VWDTGIAAYALTDCGMDSTHPAMQRCAKWLLEKEVKERGDWANNVADDVKPAGWFFEFNNVWYPDVDDTVMVAKALYRMGGKENRAAADRGVEWVFAMQNDDGGWAAFDKSKDHPIYDCVPFADHNAMQDPSCPDITGRTLECLAWHGYTVDHPAVSKAIDYIRSKQEPEGCWFGRWGVNYIYGTWQSVGGLRHVGYDMSQPWVQKAGEWIKSVQKEDGSFGESADSYEDPSRKGRGPSTASQTAWGVMTLMTICGHDDPAVKRGIEWLLKTQLPSGTWDEPWFTGTGFPKVFYIRYHLYRLYFPVMGIGRWLRVRHEERQVNEE
jgi:squalene-hopene/tetraprenyl-beta-curcumene cyclase